MGCSLSQCSINLRACLGEREKRSLFYAGSGLLSVLALAERVRRLPTRMNILITNTHAGKMSVNHTLKLMLTSRSSASAYVTNASQRGIVPVRSQIVPNEIIKTPDIRRV